MEYPEHLRPFVNEVYSIANRYGNIKYINLIPIEQSKTARSQISDFYESGYVMNIHTNTHQVRQDILEAFENGLKFIESIMFVCDTIIFFPKAF